MEKKEKNEEIQSRREFFKQAAKKALPILGVMALVSLPIVTKASVTKTTDCDNSCSSGCTGSCATGCSSCSGSCSGTCTGGCGGTCGGTCTSSAS